MTLCFSIFSDYFPECLMQPSQANRTAFTKEFFDFVWRFRRWAQIASSRGRHRLFFVICDGGNGFFSRTF